MKNKRAIFVVFLSLLSSLPAFGEDEGRIGNGGGGFHRNGQYLTFGSAGVRIGLTPVDVVPALDQLQESLQGLRLGKLTSGNFLQAVLPDDQRRYFQVEERDLPPKEHARLTKAYRDALGPKARGKKLAVFAVTSRETRETYLLPAFFALKPVEQQAILFHEGLWIHLPEGTTYERVIDAEIKFQHYVENGARGYDAELFPVLDEIFQDPMISLKAALRDDLASGVLDEVLFARGGSDRTLIHLDALYGSVGVPEPGLGCRYGTAKCTEFRMSDALANGPYTYAYSYDAERRALIASSLMARRGEAPDSKAVRRLYEIRHKIYYERTVLFLSTEPPILDLADLDDMPAGAIQLRIPAPMPGKIAKDALCTQAASRVHCSKGRL